LACRERKRSGARLQTTVYCSGTETNMDGAPIAVTRPLGMVQDSSELLKSGLRAVRRTVTRCPLNGSERFRTVQNGSELLKAGGNQAARCVMLDTLEVGNARYPQLLKGLESSYTKGAPGGGV
jgi:hypothetical protein